MGRRFGTSGLLLNQSALQSTTPLDGPTLLACREKKIYLFLYQGRAFMFISTFVECENIKFICSIFRCRFSVILYLQNIPEVCVK